MTDVQNAHVQINDLSFNRGERVVFAGVNLTIPRGKITAIMGPSGCGKTTLLQLIGGQLQPDRGRVLVDDVDINTLSLKQLYKMRRGMGMLFQSGGLFTNLTVFENVAFPLREHTKLSETMIRDLVLMKLEAVGLRGAAPLMPAELSGGMARRVAMARALALDPKLMMYDEPFTGQDPVTMAVLVNLIAKLNKAFGLTSIIVSHDVPETVRIADYIYLLGEGQIIAGGTPEAMLTNQAPAVQQFMEGFTEAFNGGGRRTTARIPDNTPIAALQHYPAVSYEEDIEL